jgi:hypothetical protein
MVEKITLPAELRAKLMQANDEPVPIFDAAGNLVGYYLTPAQFHALSSLASEEELDAAEQVGGSHSMDDVFKLLERK